MATHFITVREFSRRFSRHIQNVYALLWAAKLPGIRRGGRWYIDLSMLDADGRPLPQSRRGGAL